MALESDADLFTLGELANLVRERKNGNVAYYNVNDASQSDQRLRLSLHLLRVSGRPEEPEGLRDVGRADPRARRRSRARAARPNCTSSAGCTISCRTSGTSTSSASSTTPIRELHLKAYTAVEWDWFQRLTGRSTRDLLAEFKDAGLGSLPGGGAEIFHPEVRDKICEHKADTDAWLRIHREAHELGLRSNATMLYGHIEKPEHRIDHLFDCANCKTRPAASKRSSRWRSIPDNTELGRTSRSRAAIMDLRMIAISRLMLDNFPHIKAYWIMLGIPTAQLALSYGADDIDGTVVHEKIYHDAGSDSPQELTVAELRRLIEEAGRVPIERDTLYHEVVRDEKRWRSGRALSLV